MRSRLFVLMRVHQRGAVLLLAMVFTAMLAVLATTLMRVGTFEFRMAGNQQFRLQAMQQAEAVAVELAQHQANFPLQLAPGDAICSAGLIAAGCRLTATTLVAPASAAVPPGVVLGYSVSRQEPELLRDFPLRESQSRVSGSGHFSAALFEVRVDIDGGATRLASASVVQGVAIRLAAMD